MNLTFIIGNGFDICNGIPTRYVDFYSEAKISEKNRIFKEIINNIEDWSDFELALGKLTWDSEFSKRIGYTSDDFLEDFEEIMDELINYLKRCNISFYVENEAEMRKKFKKQIAGFFDEVSYKEGKLIEEKIIKDVNLNVNFVSFNYTYILDNIVERIDEKYIDDKNLFSINISNDIEHVHGSLAYYPIAGVSEPKQINEKFINENGLELLIKPKADEALGHGGMERSEMLISNSNVLYIFGMSLGDSDSYWWNRILLWLGEDNDRFVIVSNFNRNINLLHSREKLKNIRITKKKLLKYISNPDESNMLSKQILVVDNPEIFDYKEFLDNIPLDDIDKSMSL